MHSSVVKLSTSILLFTYFFINDILLSFKLWLGCCGVCRGGVGGGGGGGMIKQIEPGIVRYCKLSVSKMISNSAYGLVRYYLLCDNLQDSASTNT